MEDIRGIGVTYGGSHRKNREVAEALTDAGVPWRPFGAASLNSKRRLALIPETHLRQARELGCAKARGFDFKGKFYFVQDNAVAICTHRGRATAICRATGNDKLYAAPVVVVDGVAWGWGAHRAATIDFWQEIYYLHTQDELEWIKTPQSHYNVWHICCCSSCCKYAPERFTRLGGKIWTHSQGDWNEHLREVRPTDILTFPTKED